MPITSNYQGNLVISGQMKNSNLPNDIQTSSTGTGQGQTPGFTYVDPPTLANHYDFFYTTTKTFAGTTPQNIELRGSGAIEDIAGSVGISVLKSIYIRNNGDDDLVLTGDFISGLGATSVTLEPGEVWFRQRVSTTGFPITDSTNDTITITPADGGSASVTIVGIAA